MESSAELLISLALILLAARITSSIATALALPSVFGVLVAGVLLGPSVTGLVHLSPALEGMSSIGVVLLLFVAGIETDLVEMRRVGIAATLAAVGGVALPMAGAAGLAIWFGYGVSESVFIGTIMTATSVTVSAHVLKEAGFLQSRIGSAILGAAVIDDIIGVIVLTVVISIEGGGGMGDLVRLGLFLPGALLVGHFVTKLAAVRLVLMETREHRFLEVLALVLAFAWAAQEIGGLAAISGAYLAGVLFGRTILQEDLADFGNLIGYALFAPIFFVTTGMSADLEGLRAVPLFTAALLAVAIVTKVVGCYGGVRLGGFSHQDSLAVGTGMIARGEVALVIAVLGHQSGVIGDEVYTASIAVTLLTTLAAPLLLRVTLPKQAPSAEHDPESEHRLQLASQIEALEHS
ncbi:MAG: cation:proton antiporter [Dehalococcoidia bacterium]|nr:MAG: cation:proton antiporter [Dehalococcoidia bacterium]